MRQRGKEQSDAKMYLSLLRGLMIRVIGTKRVLVIIMMILLYPRKTIKKLMTLVIVITTRRIRITGSSISITFITIKQHK